MSTRARTGRTMGTLGACAAVLLVTAALALGARGGRQARDQWPNYAIPNVVGAVMCLVVLVIPCKRFRRT